MLKKPKNVSLLFSFILIFIFGLGVGVWLGRSGYISNESWTVGDRNASEGDRGVEDTFVGEYEVARVIDGDTIEIAGGERVRYIGMDTPETVDPARPVECFGPEATVENKKLVAGKKVRLEKDTTNRDHFGRLLRYFFIDDILIALELVKLGFARAEAYPPDLRYQDELSAAQQQAQKNNLGLWAVCQN